MMTFALYKWIFYSIIICSYANVCQVANQPSRSSSSSSSASDEYLQVTDDIITKSQSYNKLVDGFRENWESPFTYLVQRGYIPAEEAKPNKFSRNAIEKMQKKITADKQDSIDLAESLDEDSSAGGNQKDIPRDLEKICNISIPTLPELTTHRPTTHHPTPEHDNKEPGGHGNGNGNGGHKGHGGNGGNGGSGGNGGTGGNGGSGGHKGHDGNGGNKGHGGNDDKCGPNGNAGSNRKSEHSSTVKTVTISPDEGECEEYYDDVTECYYVDDDEKPTGKAAKKPATKESKPTSTSATPTEKIAAKTTTTAAPDHLPKCKLTENEYTVKSKFQYQYHPSHSQNVLLKIPEQDELNPKTIPNALKLAHKIEPIALIEFSQNRNKSLNSKYPLLKTKRTNEFIDSESNRKKTDVQLPSWYSPGVNLVWPPFDVPYQSASRIWHYYNPPYLIPENDNSAKVNNAAVDHPGRPHTTQPSRQSQSNQQNQKGNQNAHNRENEQPQKVSLKPETKTELRSDLKNTNENFPNLSKSNDQSPKIIGKEVVFMTNEKGDPLSKQQLALKAHEQYDDMNDKSSYSEKPDSYIALNAVYILHKKPEENVPESNSPDLNAKETMTKNSASRLIREDRTIDLEKSTKTLGTSIDKNIEKRKLPNYSLSDEDEWINDETNNYADYDSFSSLNHNSNSWSDLDNDLIQTSISNKANDLGYHVNDEILNAALKPLDPINIWSETDNNLQDNNNQLSYDPLEIIQSNCNTKNSFEGLIDDGKTNGVGVGASADQGEFDDMENDSNDYYSETDPIQFLDSLSPTADDFSSTYQNKDTINWPKSKTYEETVQDFSTILNPNPEFAQKTSGSSTTNDNQLPTTYGSVPFAFKYNEQNNKAADNSILKLSSSYDLEKSIKKIPESFENVNHEFLKLITYDKPDGNNFEDIENSNDKPQHNDEFSDTMSTKYQLDYNALSRPELETFKNYEQSSYNRSFYDSLGLNKWPDQSKPSGDSNASQKYFAQSSSDDYFSSDPEIFHPSQTNKNFDESSISSSKGYVSQSDSQPFDKTNDETIFDRNSLSLKEYNSPNVLIKSSQDFFPESTFSLKPNNLVNDVSDVDLPKQPKRDYAYSRNYPSDDILNLYRYKNMRKDLEQYFQNDKEPKPTPKSYTQSQIRTALQISRVARGATTNSKLLPEYKNLIQATAKNITESKFPSLATADSSNESAIY